MKRLIVAAAVLALAAAVAPAQEPSQPLDQLDDRLVVPAPAHRTRRAPAKRTRPAPAPARAPTAERVLDRYVEVTGGRDAYLKHKSMIVKGTVEIVGAGVTGTMETYSVAPNRLSFTLALAGVGTSKEVYDGVHAWESSPLTGVRELTGSELALLKRQASFNAEVNWRDLWKSAEIVGTQPVGDRTATVVKMTPNDGGNSQTSFYDAETGLLLRTETVVDTPSATVPVVVIFSDYRSVGGVKIPFASEQQLPSVTLKTVFTDVTFDANIKEDVFAKPQ